MTLSQNWFLRLDSLQASTPEKCRPFDRHRTEWYWMKRCAPCVGKPRHAPNRRGAPVLAESSVTEFLRKDRLVYRTKLSCRNSVTDDFARNRCTTSLGAVEVSNARSAAPSPIPFRVRCRSNCRHFSALTLEANQKPVKPVLRERHSRRQHALIATRSHTFERNADRICGPRHAFAIT